MQQTCSYHTSGYGKNVVINLRNVKKIVYLRWDFARTWRLPNFSQFHELEKSTQSERRGQSRELGI
jgi:hypothetical protein